jgi:uncharacterized repeat protein (TIGR03803 family)
LATLFLGFVGTLFVTRGGGGGGSGAGTVFKITSHGELTTMHIFCTSGFPCTDGAYPSAGLAQGNDGNFYGTTEQGGTYYLGSVFKITPDGTLTTLHSFDGTDGAIPHAGLTQGIDGSFYGTTTNKDEGFPGICSSPDCGTVFNITPFGTLTTLHTFSYTDGAYPHADLIQATNGDFYGTTSLGGTNCTYYRGCGTVFSLSLSLGPFVRTLPALGKVGSVVEIFGPNLTGTTSVTFSGVAATFKISSPTLITATVPSGATTGTVQVMTPTGTLSSNAVFRVR